MISSGPMSEPITSMAIVGISGFIWRLRAGKARLPRSIPMPFLRAKGRSQNFTAYKRKKRGNYLLEINPHYNKK